MNARIKRLRKKVREREFKQFLSDKELDFIKEMDEENLPWVRRVARLTKRMCEAQDAVIDDDERIVFTQTTQATSVVYPERDWKKIVRNKTLHEGTAIISNICPNWELILSQGLLGRKNKAYEARKKYKDNPHAADFLDSSIETIKAILQLADRYRLQAEKCGRIDISGILSNVPANPPRSFHEGLQFVRLILAVTWLVGHYQIGLGRIDQYMMPYLNNDLVRGNLSYQQAEELLADFFLSLNKDNYLYPGAQPGDNGQTIVLGGIKKDGSTAVNELTYMALNVSCQLGLIDPKINLRINMDTGTDLLCKATELTSKGLGFPQYLNDDTIIPALVSHGYDLEDARDYTVAGCWEPIIPGKGMEIVNTGAVSFPAAADKAIRAGLTVGQSFEWIMEHTKLNIEEQTANILDSYAKLLLAPSPLLSLMMDNCLEEGRDLSEGLKYNNFGVWGACAVSAAEALAVVKSFVFEQNVIPPADLLSALETDFEQNQPLHNHILDKTPRVGTNDEADGLMVELFNWFADTCENYGLSNRGGIIRPGVSTAMYYMWLAKGYPGMREPLVGTTADGRKKGEPFSANLAPSPIKDATGPISLLNSFSKIDFIRLYNGGPVTLEFSEAFFRNYEAVEKTALFIKAFVESGCQQLQLNTLNRDKLLEAKAQPRLYKDLIVRVWGWSGYFCELDPEYQDQIIARQIYLE